jgi:hypothetical protein
VAFRSVATPARVRSPLTRVDRERLHSLVDRARRTAIDWHSPSPSIWSTQAASTRRSECRVGALADELREGRDFGQCVAAHALIVQDDGSFRRLLVFVDEGQTGQL